MKLIDEWRSGWKLLSVQANALGAAIIGGYEILPQDFKSNIPQHYMLWAAGGTFVLGIIGRFVKQAPTDEATK